MSVINAENADAWTAGVKETTMAVSSKVRQKLALAQFFHGAWDGAQRHEQKLDLKRDEETIGHLAKVCVAAREGFWALMGFMPWECESFQLNTENPSPKVVRLMTEADAARKKLDRR